MINFGLTGRETQDEFNIEKYAELACQSPRGVLLQQWVEENWDQWCYMVDDAPFMRYWRNSVHKSKPCVSPAGRLNELCTCGSIPLEIYSTAVWGYGIENWLQPTYQVLRPYKHNRKVSVNVATEAILQLQNTKSPNADRNYMYDNPLYLGTGLLIPYEIGLLDRWLQPTWTTICAKLAHKL